MTEEKGPEKSLTALAATTPWHFRWM